MMLPYDAWIDTREKRVHVCMLIFLIVSIIFIIPYILLGILLVSRGSYTSLFEMLSYPILDSSYISRVILDAISLTKVTPLAILKLLLENIGTMELLEGFVCIMAYALYINKKKTTYVISLLLAEFIVCTILVVIALRASSLNGAIIYIRLIGQVFLIVNIVLLVIAFLSLYITIGNYKESLAYEVEEIKEHMED
ncbi:hypothetical protein [Absiella sp. AM29-15]|uniref:hypothetical protein n=1 Tax=Absiella sp. AM29-15 TaxID=2292278 RepID=UPI000E4078DD|nr:hypothetical protein [Absiella sp. AM29-15]RGC50855.1 hypothetical protein DW761_11320 [Absiella sp. AM29-15]